MKRKPINTAGLYLKKFKFFFLSAVALALLYGYWQWANLPVDWKNSTEKNFIVPQGQPTVVIAQRLKRAKLIKSPLIFRLVVERKGLSGKLQAGEFHLSSAMDLNTIVSNLSHGSLDFWITFPEGLRTEEYAALLEGKAKIDPQAFILAAKPFEGRLFPDTYLIPNTVQVEDVVKMLTDTFNKKSPTQDKQAIIIASLIEREARHDQDRKLVSGVIHNRLKLGMALQVDASVQYILGRKSEWWPKNLTHEDLRVNSPYNTYVYPGLPPAPIANPGLTSLEAAMNPADTDYLYYVSDAAGYNHYAFTLEEHQKNIAQYLPLDN